MQHTRGSCFTAEMRDTGEIFTADTGEVLFVTIVVDELQVCQYAVCLLDAELIAVIPFSLSSHRGLPCWGGVWMGWLVSLLTSQAVYVHFACEQGPELCNSVWGLVSWPLYGARGS